MMVPAVMEYRLSQPQSWGSKVYNALGARIRIMMDDFENQQSQLDNLFNLITSRIHPLTKGNDTARNEEIYTQSGKIRSWLKEHTSMTKVERTKYSQVAVIYSLLPTNPLLSTSSIYLYSFLPSFLSFRFYIYL